MGQEHPFIERGATADSLSSIDSVNHANGNGVLRIPIGPTYNEGGKLSFGLTLWYNSKIWDTEAGRYDDPIVGNIPEAYPSRKSNAGIGWTLTVGRLIHPVNTPDSDPLNPTQYWMYIGPDGASHYFYPRLHGGASGPTDVLYSRDGSYLRFKITGQALSPYTIEFPDGLIHTFDQEGRLHSIEDRNSDSNGLQITYSFLAGRELQEIRDKHGRVWRLYWDEFKVSGSIPEKDRTYNELVKVELPAVADTSATYDFRYRSEEVDMGCFAPFTSVFKTLVRLLDAIDLPQTDSGRMHYKMKYYASDEFNQTNCKSSALEELTLPTGGRIRLDYVKFEIPRHCQPQNSGPFLWGRSNAVRTREYLDIDGRSLAKWTYRYFLSEPPTEETHLSARNLCEEPASQDQASELITTLVEDPLGDRTFYFHIIWPLGDLSEHGATVHDYFLPYIKPGIEPRAPGLDELDGPSGRLPSEDGGDRFLSSVRLNCDPGDSTLDSCELYRAEYVAYESEVPYDLSGPFDFNAHSGDRNQRVISQRRVYYRDSPSETDLGVTTHYTDFDGLGHFRQMEGISTFPDEDSWSVLTEYNSAFSTFELGSDHLQSTTSTWAPPDEAAPWVLGTYDSILMLEPGRGGKKIEYQFDPDQGLLLRERILADLSENPGRETNDILLVHGYDMAGNRTSTSRYGGDQQNDLDDIEIQNLVPEGWEYRTEWGYLYGVVSSEDQAGATGDRLRVFDRAIDQNTGLVLSETDTADVTTEFRYDVLGRMTDLIPAADSPTTAVHTDVVLGAKPVGETVTVEQLGASGMVSESVIRDGFGRNVRYERNVSGATAYTLFEYGSNGLLYRTSSPEYEGSAPRGWTVFSDYDPDGRALIIDRPDGSRTTLTIDADYEFVEKKRAALVGGDGNVFRKLLRDSRGRLLTIFEGSVPTSYDYDVEGRLIKVGTPIGDGNQQKRLFEYDSRGFLLSATHPEMDAVDTSGATEEYGAYDTLGNPGTFVDGARRLDYVYDEFGRMTQLYADGSLMADNFYARSNNPDGLDRRDGKLVQTRRHNYVDGEDVVVTQTLSYRDPQGRLTHLRTRSNEGFSFEQTMGFDDLGNLQRQTLPHSLPSLMADPVRTVDYTYNQTFLDKIDSRLGSAASETIVKLTTYNPLGKVRQVRHSNGVNWTFERDPDGMPRPRSIGTSGVVGSEDWQSGDYRYDGSGNIKEIGGDLFSYDAFQRLVYSKIGNAQQDYAYDRFGNMTQMGANNFSVDSSRNRLDSFYVYDPAGRVLQTTTTGYEYDGLNMITHRDYLDDDDTYIYGPDNERLAVINDATGRSLVTVRDASSRVSREYTQTGPRTWVASKDYLYSNRLVASYSYEANEWRHYHPDHLGSPRLITDENGNKVAEHTYLPYGEELIFPDSVEDGERFKFTSHERDAKDQDYMHARYYSPRIARFLSLDSGPGRMESPQTLNRYLYAVDSPVNFVDPDGREVVPYVDLGIKISDGLEVGISREYVEFGKTKQLPVDYYDYYDNGVRQRWSRTDVVDQKATLKLGKFINKQSKTRISIHTVTRLRQLGNGMVIQETESVSQTEIPEGAGEAVNASAKTGKGTSVSVNTATGTGSVKGGAKLGPVGFGLKFKFDLGKILSALKEGYEEQKKDAANERFTSHMP